MKKLIFLGGSKGVGKSSLARMISEERELEYINTGDRVRKYKSNFGKFFCRELINLDHDVLIDTHYAASSRQTPYDFLIGLDEKYLKSLRFSADYEGKIILITADPQIILSRRKKDGDSRRSLELAQIIKENNFNDAYSKIYSSWLGLERNVFKNHFASLNEAMIQLRRILK